MKKFLALVLAVLMVLSMVACNNTPVETNPPATQGGNDTPTQPKETEPQPKDPVTITYWYGGQGMMEDTLKVQDKLNEILKTIPGYEYISIELHPMTSFKKNFELAQADKEQIDIVASYYLDVSGLWNNDAILPMDELLEKFPNVTSQIPEFMVPMGQIDGQQAYIPSAQQATTMYFMRFNRQDFTAYMDDQNMSRATVSKILQSNSIKATMDLIEDYTLWLRAYKGYESIFCLRSGEMNLWFQQEYIGSDYGKMIIAEDRGVVEWVTLTEEYKYWLGRMADWYERGLLPEDPVIKFSTQYGEQDSWSCGYGTDVATEEMVEKRYMNGGQDHMCFQVRDHYYVPSVYAAGGTFIYADCEHPEEAMMVLELLHTDLHGDEFYNTLVWGLEGKHYEWVDKENKRIKTLEFDGPQGTSSCSYQAWKWQIGNSFKAWKNQAVDDAQNDYINAVHADPSTVPSVALGMTWDLSEVDDIVMQLNAINTEYAADSIWSLGKDWKARYDEMVTKLKVAGVDLAVKELNEQIADYLKK